MVKEILAKQLNVQQRLIIVCLLVSALALVSAAFYEWSTYRAQKEKQMLVLAKKQTKEFDQFIQDILKSKIALQVSHQQLKNCETNLLPALQGVVFNKPYLSAISIIDNAHKLHCSTLPLQLEKSHQGESTHLYGPVYLESPYKPFYVLEKPMGHYQLRFYILKNIVDNLFQPFWTTAFEAILVYDPFNISPVISIVTPISSHSMPIKNTQNTLSIPSQTLKNYQLLFMPKGLIYDKQFIYSELLIIFSIIAVALIIYFVLRNILTHRFSLAYALKNGLKLGHFEPIYQPILDMSKQKCSGAEVLVRWQMASNTMVMPDLFIEEAEKSGLIIPITLQLAEKSFKQCQNLLIKHPDFHLAFNISADHFSDADFFPQFFELCNKFKIPPNQILFELTERRLFDQNDQKSIVLMDLIRSKGFSMAIDDFGTGHASINYLRHLPFNYIKIDKQFVQAIGTGAITETLNQAIINMARSLNLFIIAEGVETEEQYQFLFAQQVEFIQGWYYAKAMNINNLSDFIQGENL